MIATCVLTIVAQATPLPFLNPVISEHMVLQRGKPNTIWGWTKPGTRVVVAVGKSRASGVADANGKWTVRIAPPPAGGPYSMTVDGTEHVKFDDILVGDVWVCGGQSNMEFGLGNVINAKEEIANSADPNLRIAIASKQFAFSPKPTVPIGWRVCGPDTVGQGGWQGFSAVGYYFGRKLRSELGVPIGLIEDCWGGTSAEAWASEPGLRSMPDFADDFRMISELRAAKSGDYGTYIDSWLAQNDIGSMPGANWSDPTKNVDGWRSLPTADAPPEGKPVVTWLRKDVELPATLPDGRAELVLGRVRDVDTLWVNGKVVWGQGRYWLWPSSIKPGRNTFVLRAFSRGGRAGLAGPADRMVVQLGDGTKIPMGADWKAMTTVDASSVKKWPKDTNINPSVPSVLYNGMIAPITPLAITGAIWYQGETNVGRGAQYRTLLPSMIRDWRRAFGQGDFPFYIVSLANYMRRNDQPGDDAWAELREAQAYAAMTTPNAGLAITIDVGEANDIHPKNKKTVGERLAAVALAKKYTKSIPYSGPVYKSLTRFGQSLRLEFDHVDGGLVAKGGVLEGFAVAGLDRKWHWATATIDGKSVLVTSPDVRDPVAARYAWGNNPAATLYNGADFPAVPFRTDDWVKSSK